MQPSQVLANTVSTLVSADTTQLASATNNKLHLAAAPFTPSLALLIGGLTEAAYTGYAALSAGATGTQTTFFDPATGNAIVEVKAPTGGWLWKTTSLTGLPVTIYGSYLTDTTSAVLLGSQLLTPNVTLTAIGQGIEIPNVRFTFPPSPMT